jgi:hypothetical protein
MARKSKDTPLLGGPFIFVYHLGERLPGDLPNEIIFTHPVTKAKAVFSFKKQTGDAKDPHEIPAVG